MVNFTYRVEHSREVRRAPSRACLASAPHPSASSLNSSIKSHRAAMPARLHSIFKHPHTFSGPLISTRNNLLLLLLLLLLFIIIL